MSVVVIIPARCASARLPGKPLADILEPLEMTVAEFVKICDRFTNKKIFAKNGAGELVK
ncbi:MAG: hypothetical protein WCH13_17505, partial [Deltaproteobacteria bacterium]